MRKIFFLLAIVMSLALPATLFAQAENTPQAPEENAYRAEVVAIVDEGERTVGGVTNKYQDVTVRLLDGPRKGDIIPIRHGDVFTINDDLLVSEGEKIVVLQFPRPDGSSEYIISEKYRVDSLMLFAGFFLFLILLVARWKGLGSILGLGISFLVIIFFLIPLLLAGKDPLLVSISSATAILLVTMYLAHGFSKRTTVALASTIIAFIITGIISVVIVHVSRLTGLGSEDAYALQYGVGEQINFRGLFLGGILIGALGVLDDVTTSLTTSIFELAKNHKNASVFSLFRSGMTIGTEHITSLVNTLVLAYAGASLPLFLFFVVNPSGKPWWAIMNNELIAEEIVRTLGGSFGLILAVPITALLASWIAMRSLKN